MSRKRLIEEVEKKHLNNKIPDFNVGDTISVHVKIVEGAKERFQVFTGTVIARKGCGVSETISVYRNAYGCNMERVFLLNSPMIAKIEKDRPGKVKRAKLTYLRGACGRKAKIEEQMGAREEALGLDSSSAQAPIASTLESKVSTQNPENAK